MPSDRIVRVSDLGGLRKRMVGQTIVLATGCFDILHVGHLYFLEDAASQGNVLIVALNSDRSIKMIKGDHRPIVRENERAELVAAFRCVDYVFVFDDIAADDCIRSLRPDIFVIGENSVKAYPSESAAAEQIGARVHVVLPIQSPSTTSIVAEIIQRDL